MNLFLNLYPMERWMLSSYPRSGTLSTRVRVKGRHRDYRSPQGCERLHGPSDWLGGAATESRTDAGGDGSIQYWEQGLTERQSLRNR